MLHAGQITAQCDAVFPVTAWLRRRVVSRQVGKDAFRAVPQPVGLCLSVVDGDGANGVVSVTDLQFQGFFAAS